ncbi:hypothetical protein [Actinophytocola oryzae]|nr:hypothetical protein [Actinophytocola oryzae]
MAMVPSGQPVVSRSWRQLCDRGSDLVLCLDFATTPASTAFAALASSSLVEARILHIGQSGPGPQDTWVREVVDTGDPVSAVLGHGEACALATAVADAIAVAGGSPPTVVLFDAAAVTPMRTGTPLYLSSRDHRLDHERNISLDVDSRELLTDPEVVKVVADLLKGARSWST